MKPQAKAFIEGEGRAWLDRNEHRLPIGYDPVRRTLETYNIIPTEVLEIGCANGWRLDELKARYSCNITGIDPSVDPSQRTNRNFFLGTADDLPFAPCFDLVIYGFCLYLCDREDLFTIVSEGDRVLQERGHLVIYDFHQETSYSREYAHKPPLRSHKMDHSKLWLANPAYSVVARQMFGDDDETTSVTILQKDTASAWPLRK